MLVWHLTPDAGREPHRVSPGERVALWMGTWPIEPGQIVWVRVHVAHADGLTGDGQVEATWVRNEGENSYWRADLGPFGKGDVVTYEIRGRSPLGDVASTASRAFRVGPKLYLAILWHQHQPMYKDTSAASAVGSYLHPWVRLHAIRDYYSMAALAGEHPALHLTINLTPSLLWQLEDYLDRGATDRSLDLTLKPAETLTREEREYVLTRFFDADWHHQIFPHARYRELFARRYDGKSFDVQELRDVQMWFNLAWFGKEFRDGDVSLPTGTTVSVRRFVEQGRDFRVADVQAMVDAQYAVMRAIVPLHRQLQECGQIEISTTPFFHPILPLLIDTDRATIDRPGTSHPRRFAHPDDAIAQVESAAAYHEGLFGRRPSGMWPAEGAVSQSVVPCFAAAGVRWIATDEGVLARSGRWGYQVDDPDVLCRPYRAHEADRDVAVFFRDQRLSDGIGFRYRDYDDYDRAARDFIDELKARLARRLRGNGDRVASVILDGENAWGAYRDDARGFLHALYARLESDGEIETVTFSEYLDGDVRRGIAPHAIAQLPQVYDLFTGSWIDENGSAPGVDLGTWIGEDEENDAWNRLGIARDLLTARHATPDTAPDAFRALYMAEGSDWFWWFGDDQDSGSDDEFDDLFRMHLKAVYRRVGVAPPADLDRHIVPHAVVWTFANRVNAIQSGDRLTIRTNCPGVLTWQFDTGATRSGPLVPVGGVMAGLRRHHLTLGPVPSTVHTIHFRFRCAHVSCTCEDACCSGAEQMVAVR